MDKHRPKRPTSLDLFPRRQTQTGSQDSINNNSLGKKDSWKASPQITGDGKPQAKAEDKVRHVTRRPAPKPPANGPNGRTGASDARVRTREKQPPPATNPPSSGTARTQRRAGAGGAVPARGGGRGGTAAREGDVRRKDGAAGREDRKGGRLCEEFKTRDKDRSGHSRLREANGPKSRGADGKGGAKGAHRGGGQKANNPACSQEVYLTAMVVPRTPVAPRNQDKTQTQGQNHDRPPDSVPALSRSSSEGGSNRMSLGSDTEGPPPGPPQPGGPHPLNPDITEEEGEGDPTPCAVFQTGPSRRPLEDEETQMDSTKSEVDAGGGVGAEVVEGSGAGWGVEAGQGGATSQSAAGLCYDAVKYTLVVDEHARLELVSLKDCFHGYPNKHNEDSDTETVYQSANEEEDPEYEEERRREEEEEGGGGEEEEGGGGPGLQTAQDDLGLGLGGRRVQGRESVPEQEVPQSVRQRERPVQRRRSRFLWLVLLRAGWSRAAAEPPGRLQVCPPTRGRAVPGDRRPGADHGPVGGPVVPRLQHEERLHRHLPGLLHGGGDPGAEPSPERRLDRTVPGAVPGLSPGPRPQRQQCALCRHAEGGREPAAVQPAPLRLRAGGQREGREDQRAGPVPLGSQGRPVLPLLSPEEHLLLRLPPETQQVLWVHHQASRAAALRLPRDGVGDDAESPGGVCWEGVPAVLPRTRGRLLSHGGHLYRVIPSPSGCWTLPDRPDHVSSFAWRLLI